MLHASNTRAGHYPVRFPASPLPPRAGVGFKPEHFVRHPRCPAAAGLLEVHAENYMGAGGPPHAKLSRLKRLRPLDPRRRTVDRLHAAARP